MFILVFRGPLRQRKGHYSNGNKFFKELGLIKAIFKFIHVRDSLDIAAIKWTAVYTHDLVVTLYMIPYNVPLYKFILLSWGSLTTLLPWATFDTLTTWET